ncbi:MAG TPA: alpha/beta hydrolase [Micromonosporaceae bacterium]|nr:alpha/beta hydrolase [Micromonosporaceae bacterium]
MPHAVVDGIATRYEVTGDGPPLLMFSPGGFHAVASNWSEHGVYRRLDLLPRLSERYSCITFDRRESGGSGGRVQRLGWPDYVAQGLGLLDHLGAGSAYLMGGCVGCSVAVACAVAAPSRVSGLVLYSPAGGARYRLRQHARLGTHRSYAAAEGLAGVVSLALSTGASFTDDPRGGPWCEVIRSDPAFAAVYAALDGSRYDTLIAGTVRAMFDRDTVPGAEPEDLLLLDTPALIVPGDDESHAPSAAHYLHECLRRSELWDVPVAQQTASNAPDQILDFLDSTTGRGVGAEPVR